MDPPHLSCRTLTLVYHAARNVRHLIREHAVEREPWKYLVALAQNRNEAWGTLQNIRSEACKAETAGVVVLPFERRFRPPQANCQRLEWPWTRTDTPKHTPHPHPLPLPI